MNALMNDLLLSLDPVAFAIALGFVTPDPWQEQVLRWFGKRLLLNCARQSGKSTIAAILALHCAIYNPGSLILLVSPSQRQSTELFKKVSFWRDRLIPKLQLNEANRLSYTFYNGSRVISLPSSEDTIRGFSGANLIIEDEASRVSDELYFAIRPMLAVSDGRLILMSTPFGKRGHFFQEWEKGGDEWKKVKIPATMNPRISAEFLEEERRSLGDWWFQQEYLCGFVETVDQVFDYEIVMNAISSDVKPIFESEVNDGLYLRT
jgi:hypothetical protein